MIVENTQIRDVRLQDLEALLELESASFKTDRLSRRSFVRWIKAENRVFLALEHNAKLIGYGLVMLNRRTRIARLYSIAINANSQGMGFGETLMRALETGAIDMDRLFMRLEVSKHNQSALKLYHRLGYQTIAELPDYYQDHTDALRMQKQIRFPPQ